MTTPLITMAQINTLPDNPSKDGPTHLQDHAIIAKALKGYIPYVITHAETIPTLAPAASPVFTGTAVIPTMRYGTSATLGQVLTASSTSGGVQWADPAVASVAGKTGVVTLSVSDIDGVAPIDSPVFHGSISTPFIAISGDENSIPRVGQVLTALNEGGQATWADRTVVVDALPPEDEMYRGVPVVVEEDGEADKLYVCLRQASGLLRWHEVTVGPALQGVES